MVSKVFEKLVNTRIVDLLEKCDLFSDFQSLGSTADLLTVVSDRIVGVFNRAGPTQAVIINMPTAFNMVWHAGLLHKRKCGRISDQAFDLISSFLSFECFWMRSPHKNIMASLHKCPFSVLQFSYYILMIFLIISFVL